MRCLAGHKSEVNIITNLSMTISKSNDASEQRKKRIISQMAQVNCRNKHRRMQNIRHSGTGHWLIDTHEYKSWRDCKISCAMSCYGICELGWSSFLVEYWVVFAGSGKSVSISSRIDGSNSNFWLMLPLRIELRECEKWLHCFLYKNSNRYLGSCGLSSSSRIFAMWKQTHQWRDSWSTPWTNRCNRKAWICQKNVPLDHIFSSTIRPLQIDELRGGIAFTINDTFWDPTKTLTD